MGRRRHQHALVPAAECVPEMIISRGEQGLVLGSGVVEKDDVPFTHPKVFRVIHRVGSPVIPEELRDDGSPDLFWYRKRSGIGAHVHDTEERHVCGCDPVPGIPHPHTPLPQVVVDPSEETGPNVQAFPHLLAQGKEVLQETDVSFLRQDEDPDFQVTPHPTQRRACHLHDESDPRETVDRAGGSRYLVHGDGSSGVVSVRIVPKKTRLYSN